MFVCWSMSSTNPGMKYNWKKVQMFSSRGESREGIPDIWITIGEERAYSRSRFFTPLPPSFILTTFATAFPAQTFWGLFDGGFKLSSFCQNTGCLLCWAKRTLRREGPATDSWAGIANGAETEGLTVAKTAPGVAVTVVAPATGESLLLLSSSLKIRKYLFYKFNMNIEPYR